MFDLCIYLIFVVTTIFYFFYIRSFQLRFYKKHKKCLFLYHITSKKRKLSFKADSHKKVLSFE